MTKMTFGLGSRIVEAKQLRPDRPDKNLHPAEIKKSTFQLSLQSLKTLLCVAHSIVPAESLYICCSQVVTSVPSDVICVNQSAEA